VTFGGLGGNGHCSALGGSAVLITHFDAQPVPAAMNASSHTTARLAPFP